MWTENRWLDAELLKVGSTANETRAIASRLRLSTRTLTIKSARVPPAYETDGRPRDANDVCHASRIDRVKMALPSRLNNFTTTLCPLTLMAAYNLYTSWFSLTPDSFLGSRK